ncbi:MAG: hypothetical protein OEZ68_11515 [Gammaproteobacteria bacterium]|nr:hypothetical protein [Gammaproteobacteria bacterium]MDH5801421.1 hypothetical protein [Gammaproteobacteria bacterium]
MTIHYQYNKDINCVYSRLKGRINERNLGEHINAVSALNTLKRGWIEILDMSQIDALDLSYSDCVLLSTQWMKLQRAGCIGAISYAPNELTFGVSRMIKATCEKKDHPVWIIRQKNILSFLTGTTT